MSAELIPMDTAKLTIARAVEDYNALVEMVKEILVKDVDFGVIPGTQKPTLLKPGAEKLCKRFGLTPVFEILDAIKDWTGKEYNGEPLFYYEIKCKLYRGERLVAEGVGSCNSWEKKYRYREAKRVCPACGLAAIIKGKAEFGGGWICFKKLSGCGAKYVDDDPVIVDQPAGLVPNADVFEQVNTIRKMADKRALVAATLIAVGASEFFTQDVEDMGYIDMPYTITVETVPASGGVDTTDEPSVDDQLARASLVEHLRAVRAEGSARNIALRKLSRADVAAMTNEELRSEIATTERTLAMREAG